jgi:hypothetical protein
VQTFLCTFSLLAAQSAATDPPAKPEKPPHALFLFSANGSPREWITTFEMTTASGARYAVRLNYSPRFIADSATLNTLLAANWLAEAEFGSSGIRIYGARTREGPIDAVRALKIINRRIDDSGDLPHLAAVGSVAVEVKADDGKTKSERTGKPFPTGPTIKDESYVEFDISPLPVAGPARISWQSSWGVFFRTGDSSYDVGTSIDIDPAKPWRALEEVLESFSRMSCKAEIVGKTRLRVYGMVLDGRYYPAIKGSVESEEIKPEELPNITSARS